MTESYDSQYPKSRKESSISGIPGVSSIWQLQGHTKKINTIAWSPNGNFLASGSDDCTVRLWDPQRRAESQILQGHKDPVMSISWSQNSQLLVSVANDQTIHLWEVGSEISKLSSKISGSWINDVAWSPDGDTIAVAPEDRNIHLLDATTLTLKGLLIGHEKSVLRLAWSPDSKSLASVSLDTTIRLWDIASRQSSVLLGHGKIVTSVAWSPAGDGIIATASGDCTVRLWDTHKDHSQAVLEGHTSEVIAVCFSPDGRLLASHSKDGTLRLWETVTGSLLATIPNQPCHFDQQIDFHPTSLLLAWSTSRNNNIQVAQLDEAILLNNRPVEFSSSYRNAKVVLVGDTGVGKSALSLVLRGKPFQPTSSTHGRRIVTLSEQEVTLQDDTTERREILLWDLAGQPGYRLIHQLYLNEVTVALVVFDARDELSPFRGVKYWDRALRQACLRKNQNNPSVIQKFLVCARSDRGGVRVSQKRIDALVKENGFVNYFETSAQEEWGIQKLKTAIFESIPWFDLPFIRSNHLLQTIKDFLKTQKEAGYLIETADNLYGSLRRDKLVLIGDPKESKEIFNSCLIRLENVGLIRRLSFGDMVLLEPELLDSYASAIVEAARKEPDGLGYIAKEDIIAGRFFIPPKERLHSRRLEELILIATVEELKQHEIAFEENTEAGPILIFPSQITLEWPIIPEIPGPAKVFSFEGPVLSIYASLAVRLVRSVFFSKQEMWKDAITFTLTKEDDKRYGIHLRQSEDSHGEITIFFPDDVPSEYQSFQNYVYIHLLRKSLPGSLSERTIVRCPNPACKYIIPDDIIQQRRKLGKIDQCPVCEYLLTPPGKDSAQVNTADLLEQSVQEMDNNADRGRIRDAAKETIAGKRMTSSYDVFLCHNNEDKAEIKRIGKQLIDLGYLPWLDEWELQPGLPWQDALEKVIGRIKSAAVFVGNNGIGPWQNQELKAFLREFVRRKCPVIPVILSYCGGQVPPLPRFLEGMTWVDFRNLQPDPLTYLIWGITGERPDLS